MLLIFFWTKELNSNLPAHMVKMHCIQGYLVSIHARYVLSLGINLRTIHQTSVHQLEEALRSKQ